MFRKKGNNPVSALSIEDTAFFCNQSAIILRSGLPLSEGVESLCEEFHGPHSESALRMLSIALNENGSLTEALKAAPVLPDYACRMIAIGEASGTLDDVLEGLSDYYIREQQILERLKSAVTYPAILTLLMGGVIAVLLFRVLPVFSRVLDSMGANGSRTGAAVTHLGVVLGSCALVITMLILLSIAGFVIGLRGKNRDKVINGVLMRLPFMRRILRTLSAERFSSVMSMLMRIGYPLEDALSLVSEIPADNESRQRILKMRDSVAEGGSFSQTISECGMFDGLHSRMLSLASSAGMLDGTLKKIAGIYGERLDRGIQTCESLIEPALVAMLAIVAGAVLLAVMVPLAGMLVGII